MYFYDFFCFFFIFISFRIVHNAINAFKKKKNSQFKIQIRLYAIGNMVIFSRQLFEQIPAQKVRNGARKNGFAWHCEAVFSIQ